MPDPLLPGCAEFSETLPQDVAQLYGQPVASSLCHLGWRPLLLTGFVINLIQKHFALERNIQEPMLRQASSGGTTLLWQADPTKTNIYIESVHIWRPDEAELRPAVLVKRNALRLTKYLLGNRGESTKEGFDTYSTRITGSHTVFCLSRQPASAELLAGEVERLLRQIGPIISQRLRLGKFMTLELGEISVVEESTQHYVVPIIVAWEYVDNWVIQELSMPFTDYLSHDLGGSVTMENSTVNL